MLITQKWGKPIKVLKCEHRFCLNCLAACFLSGKNEKKSKSPACKVNTLKADISPSFDLKTLLSLPNLLSAMLPSYRNQSVDLLCKSLTGFYMRAALALNGLKYRSRHPEVFLETGVLKIYSKFTGEYPCRSVISIKVALQIEITFLQECSPINLLHIFGAPFAKNTSGRLLLKIQCNTCTEMYYTL